MGTRHGADAYFADMGKMKFKYEIKKTFADGKIREFRVLFDPRPLL
jgi:hypothetical protein